MKLNILIFSQAVLEHIRREQFLDTMRECRRILKRDGVCSHRVDLKDHLGGGLNNLRFSPEIWESKLFVRSGFYTNRIRYREMLKLFSSAGFDVEIIEENRWNVLPIDRSQLAPLFQDISDDELLVSGFSAVLKPSKLAAGLANA